MLRCCRKKEEQNLKRGEFRKMVISLDFEFRISWNRYVVFAFCHVGIVPLGQDPRELQAVAVQFESF